MYPVNNLNKNCRDNRILQKIMSDWFRLEKRDSRILLDIDHKRLENIIKHVKLPKHMKISKIDINLDLKRINKKYAR